MNESELSEGIFSRSTRSLLKPTSSRRTVLGSCGQLERPDTVRNTGVANTGSDDTLPFA